MTKIVSCYRSAVCSLFSPFVRSGGTKGETKQIRQLRSSNVIVYDGQVWTRLSSCSRMRTWISTRRRLTSSSTTLAARMKTQELRPRSSPSSSSLPPTRAYPWAALTSRGLTVRLKVLFLHSNDSKRRSLGFQNVQQPCKTSMTKRRTRKLRRLCFRYTCLIHLTSTFFLVKNKIYYQINVRITVQCFCYFGMVINGKFS